MPSVTEKIVDLAHGVRLEFKDDRQVPRLVSPEQFERLLRDPEMKRRGQFNFDRAIPYRRVVLCPRFTLNLTNLPS